ncbi:U4/U6 small nuclear ribonucleoprotein Prp31-like [Babylonia areolata]|uniref:U4/U6 small nuclear ribonucleoprotein Prp31-like n=1 Tax=Babylonia areolata TaxID=304850 RepID=UPI003FD14ED0
MSLADELLADLEEGGEDVEQEDSDMEAEVDDIDDVALTTEKPSNSVKNVAKLLDSKELAQILNSIQEYSSQPRREAVAGPVEADPEYKLIVDANNMTVEIDNEINVIHQFVKDIYNKRFPELESLVPIPMEYICTVKELGNNILEKSKNNETLQDILTPATIMVVSVTASTTQGTGLSDEDLMTVCEGCDTAVGLNDSKKKIFDYVESRMTFIAPNLSILVGASIAAKLMGVAGGLTNLSKMPACNIMLLGAQKRTLSGFSTTAILPHTGFIYNSETVQKLPPDLRRKGARQISAKTALAARVDSFHESISGKVGDDLRAEVEGKFDKWQEPPPVKTVKPLPAPIDQPRKKRGGRRARKMKERLGLTELRKQANRMNFGEIEEDAYQEDLGFSLGTMGKAKSGKVRGPPVDSKTKARISKTLQQKLSKQNQTWGGSTTVKKQVAGTASSVAFTPLQGLEIVNPQAAEKKAQEANQKYFSSTAGFLKINKS